MQTKVTLITVCTNGWVLSSVSAKPTSAFTEQAPVHGHYRRQPTRVSRLADCKMSAAAVTEEHGTLKDTNIIKTHFLLQILGLYASYDPVWMILLTRY